MPFLRQVRRGGFLPALRRGDEARTDHPAVRRISVLRDVRRVRDEPASPYFPRLGCASGQDHPSVSERRAQGLLQPCRLRPSYRGPRHRVVAPHQRGGPCRPTAAQRHRPRHVGPGEEDLRRPVHLPQLRIPPAVPHRRGADLAPKHQGPPYLRRTPLRQRFHHWRALRFPTHIQYVLLPLRARALAPGSCAGLHVRRLPVLRRRLLPVEAWRRKIPPASC